MKIDCLCVIIWSIWFEPSSIWLCKVFRKNVRWDVRRENNWLAIINVCIFFLANVIIWIFYGWLVVSWTNVWDGERNAAKWIIIWPFDWKTLDLKSGSCHNVHMYFIILFFVYLWVRITLDLNKWFFVCVACQIWI